jgi:hypothetical protein
MPAQVTVTDHGNQAPQGSRNRIGGRARRDFLYMAQVLGALLHLKLGPDRPALIGVSD